MFNDNKIAAIRATVTDGVTLGHPCCAVHDCQEPLQSQRDSFCQLHQDERKICVVTSCWSSVEAGYLTCSIATHRALEEFQKQSNTAMFQLKKRLQVNKVQQTTDAMDSSSSALGLEGDIDDDELVVEMSENSKTASICDGKAVEGNKRLRARFGRRRTHNEELCVTCCGVILGRATFFGSEAPNGVRVSDKLLYIYNTHKL